MTYPVLEHGGFIARFTIELVYDRNIDDTGHDLVGAEIRCQHCGERSSPMTGWDSVERLVGILKAHAAIHTPVRGAAK